MTEKAPPLNQLEFTPADHERAERMAKRLGYSQYAYTSTSDLWGLFCLPENPERARPGQATRPGCIIKTKELGLLFVQDAEDLGVPARLIHRFNTGYFATALCGASNHADDDAPATEIDADVTCTACLARMAEIGRTR